MHETASELHLKMCKKVAQLTRVIFYLNTKNDDYENNLKSVVHAYEHELDSTIREVPTPPNAGQHHHQQVQRCSRPSQQK